MLDSVALVEERIVHWQTRELDNPHHLNGFVGEFAFSDHLLVPEIVQSLVLYSTKYERFSQVPLDTVNSIAREVHGGEPGFVVRALERIREIKQGRADAARAENDKNIYEPTLTIDDWNTNTGETSDAGE
jgi:hypothetical protein